MTQYNFMLNLVPRGITVDRKPETCSSTDLF